ncbi:MAG: hypothetical protein MJZ28_08260 [Paludibacteraceae bacterium]|nr:hypothetical protein [Paludibacteraceae bacterium]
MGDIWENIQMIVGANGLKGQHPTAQGKRSDTLGNIGKRGIGNGIITPP